jgi:hypothetical protein
VLMHVAPVSSGELKLLGKIVHFIHLIAVRFRARRGIGRCFMRYFFASFFFT